MSDFMVNCQKLIDEGNHLALRVTLEENLPEGMMITDLVNSEGKSLLHMCTFKNNQKCFNAVIRAVKTMYKDREDFAFTLRSWVNQKTFQDEFSALHYSSYRGNIEISQSLIDLGADIKIKNQYGLDVLHIAA